MSVLVSDAITHDDIVVDCFSIDVDSPGGFPHVLVARPFLIQLFRVQDKELEEMTFIEMKRRVSAVNHMKPKGQKSDWVLALDESNVLIVFSVQYQTDQSVRIVVLQTFQIGDILQRGRTVNYEEETVTTLGVRAIIEVDPQQRFVAVISCNSFLLVFELRPSKEGLFEEASTNLVPTQVKRNSSAALLEKYKVFEDPYSVFIGSNPVSSMKFLVYPSENSGAQTTWLGVISRDVSLRYRLCWYGVTKVRELDVELVRKMPPLPSKPDILLSSKNNILLVICKSVQLCYSAPGTKLQCTLEGTDCHPGYVSKEFSALELISAGSIVSACKRSSGNHLLCSSKGNMYTLIINTGDDDPVPTLPVSQRLKTPRVEPEILNWEMRKIGEKHAPWDHLVNVGKLLGALTKGRIEFIDLRNPKRPKMRRHGNRMTFISTEQHKMYVQGDFYGSELHYRSRTLSLPATVVKKISLMFSSELGTMLVVLVSKTSDSSEDDTGLEDSILVYDSTLTLVSSYEFDIGCNCSDVLLLDGFKCHLGEAVTETVTGLDERMSHSFLAVSNYTDDQGFEKSELQLFQVGSNGKLKLDTMAVINKELSILELLNEQKFIVLGSHSILWVGVTAYCPEDSENISLKLVLSDSYTKLPCSYITQVQKCDLDGKEIIVADSLEGLYYIKFNDNEDKVDKVRHMLSGVAISGFKRVTRDGIAVVDLLGNFYLFQVKDGYKLSMISRMNLGSGPIGAIDSPRNNTTSMKDLLSDEMSHIRLCTVGTSEGSLVHIDLMGSTLDAVMSFQSTLGLEHTNTTDTIERGLADLEQPVLESWGDNRELLEQRLVRVLPNSQGVRIHYGFGNSVPEVLVADCRYILKKAQIHGVSIPSEIASTLHSLLVASE